MATDIEFEVTQVVAGQDLSLDSCKYRAVGFAGTIVASPNLAAGFLRYGAPQGKHATVIRSGVAKVMVGGAVNTPGFPLTVTTSGWCIACASGGAQIGRLGALAAASGTLVEAYLDFHTIPAWGG